MSCHCAGCHCAVVVHPAPVVAPVHPAPVVAPGHAAVAGTQATVVVKADRDVQIKVNGRVMPRRGTEELFASPELPAGRTFTYKFEAELTRDGKTFRDAKDILVQAGRRIELDFTGLDRRTASAEPGQLEVVLPPGALLTVNDVPVNANGRQTFPTTPLEKGKPFSYTVKAELIRDGNLVRDTRRVEVAAGKTSTVDFTAPEAALASGR